jgi:hypothetical protein
MLLDHDRQAPGAHSAGPSVEQSSGSDEHVVESDLERAAG